MNRGILTLTRSELLELLKEFDITRDPDTPLSIKLKASFESMAEINNISVSAEELEYILDDIGLVDNTKPLLKQVSGKISSALMRLNQSL